MNLGMFWKGCRETRVSEVEGMLGIDRNFRAFEVVSKIEEFLNNLGTGERQTKFIYRKGMIGIKIRTSEKFFGYIAPATPVEADMLQAMFEDLLAEIA